jgi:hypothetical protein
MSTDDNTAETAPVALALMRAVPKNIDISGAIK